MHGLRRTNEDKRNAVSVLLNDEEWSKWSNVEIAKRCGVGETLVRSLRAERSEDDAPRTYTTRHGTIAQMDTSRIGKTERPAAAAELDLGSTNVIPLGDRLVLAQLELGLRSPRHRDRRQSIRNVRLPCSNPGILRRCPRRA